MSSHYSWNKKSTYAPFVSIGGAYVLFLMLFLVPQTTQAEYIDSFVSEVEVYTDSTFQVAEEITYVFDDERHGIFRCIPTLHAEQPASLLKERYIEILVSEVRMDNEVVPYTADETGSEICIKVGDPDVTITGAHTYRIEYSVAGAISYQDYGGAEMYWNVTGNEWEVPMRSVRISVTSPEGILLRERACYQGEEGKTDTCQSVSEEGGVVRFSANLLDPYEGVTIAQALNRSVISHDVRERLQWAVILIPLCFLAFLVALVIGYRYKTQYKTGRTIIPQYEPYPGVKPMYAGLLFDGVLDQKDIAAGIVYLAKEGFLHIKKIDRKVLFFFEVDDYEITLTKSMEVVPDEFSRTVLELLFDAGAAVGTKITLHDLKNNYSKSIENGKKLTELRSALTKDLRDNGFFVDSYSTLFHNRPVLAIVLLIICIMSIFGIFILIAYFYFSIRRTKKGYEALDHLQGFKDFLRVTETQRYIFHNAPEKNATQFMEYLPYAIAFGVEKQWAKTFEGITISNPEWYDGGGSMNTFSAVSLTQSLDGFSSTFTTASGTSASSGGGSSGGGSGGGGGGSW